MFDLGASTSQSQSLSQSHSQLRAFSQKNVTVADAVAVARVFVKICRQCKCRFICQKWKEVWTDATKLFSA